MDSSNWIEIRRQTSLDYYDSYYSNLPTEILIEIFDYLSPSDLQSASLACRQWFNAAQHHKFLDKYNLNFYKIHFSNDNPPISLFLNSIRDYPNIVLDQVEFNSNFNQNVSIDKFWSQNADTIKYLSFSSCDLRERIFYSILKNLKALETLKIEKCRELFMSGRLFDEYTNNAEKIYFPNLKSLSITHNRYLSDSIFNRIIAMTPKLENLDMSGTHIAFHKGLYRKFYPKSQADPSESILTFHFISQFIQMNADHIKSLNFSQTLIDGIALSQLSTIVNLQLTKLELVSCDQLTNDGIKHLIKMQPQLNYLDISKSVRLTDASLIEICNTLENLETLKLKKCRALTDMGVKEIKKLKNLKCLDISECENITGASLVDGFGQDRNENLLELYVSALNLDETAVLKITENFPSLTVLDISCCFNAVTELAVQMIIKNLLRLRELNLNYCDQVSDAALTGMFMTEKCRAYEEKREISKNAENVNDVENRPLARPPGEHPVVEVLERVIENNGVMLRNQPFKISLRSRAEEEIVREAKQKELLKNMFQHRSLDNDTDWSGYTIRNLTGLRTLQLMACNKLSDISLQYGIKFLELKEISLAKCQQISTAGVSELVKNCPSLEIIDLSECHNINDAAIKLITINLKRLTHLYLDRCIQLTDHSLDHIIINCKQIKVVDVRGCRGMCNEPNLRLSSLSTLREVSMSKPGPYVTPILINSFKHPRPPPPQSNYPF